jgi:hypothetical protein
MHRLLRGWVGGSGFGTQVQLPNSLNQRFEALKPAFERLNGAEDTANEGFVISTFQSAS